MHMLPAARILEYHEKKTTKPECFLFGMKFLHMLGFLFPCIRGNMEVPPPVLRGGTA